VIAGGIFWWKYSQFPSTLLTSEQTTLEITGGGFQSALIQAGANPLFAKLYLSQHPLDFELQKGRYIIPANADVPTFLASLAHPLSENDELITFLEGWNIYDIDKTLTEK